VRSAGTPQSAVNAGTSACPAANRWYMCPAAAWQEADSSDPVGPTTFFQLHMLFILIYLTYKFYYVNNHPQTDKSISKDK
jgi:hypothetical protein